MIFVAAVVIVVSAVERFIRPQPIENVGLGLAISVVASLVNIFLGSSTLHLIISFVGVAVFIALTAWDTQRAKSEYLAYVGTEAAEKLQVMSALGLYLNLINLFQLLLTFTGQQRE